MADVDYGYGDAPESTDYGYGDPSPAADYGYGDAAPETDYGYGDAAPEADYGYGDAAPAADYGYGDAAPAADYGYGDSAPAADYGYGDSTDFGYGDEPVEQPKPKKDRPKRRCSVTKYSLDTTGQEATNQMDRLAQFRAGNIGDGAPPPESAPMVGSKGEFGASSPDVAVPEPVVIATPARRVDSVPEPRIAVVSPVPQVVPPMHKHSSSSESTSTSMKSHPTIQEQAKMGKLNRLRKRLSIFN